MRKFEPSLFSSRCFFSIGFFIGSLCLWGLTLPVSAQTVDNVDTAYERARNLAFDGERKKARELCDAILEISPNYHGVRILKGRTHAWDGNYDKARQAFEYVLDKSPKHADAHRALIDVELWSGNYDTARRLAEQAVQYHPKYPSLQLKLAKTYYWQGKNQKAMKVLDRVEALDPDNKKAADMQASIEAERRIYWVSFSYTRDWFSHTFGPRNYGTIQLSRPTPVGSLTGRLGIANRFGGTGIQPQLILYPPMPSGWYSYLGVAFSNHWLFPDYRFGTELHRSLPWGMEASVGLRYMMFSSSVIIYTGSVTKYWGNWMFTLRTYITPGRAGSSKSLSLSVRKYLTQNTYLSFSTGYGISPNLEDPESNDSETFLTSGYSAGVGIQKELTSRILINGSVGFTRQDPTFAPEEPYNRITFSTGFSYNF